MRRSPACARGTPALAIERDPFNARRVTRKRCDGHLGAVIASEGRLFIPPCSVIVGRSVDDELVEWRNADGLPRRTARALKCHQSPVYPACVANNRGDKAMLKPLGAAGVDDRRAAQGAGREGPNFDDPCEAGAPVGMMGSVGSNAPCRYRCRRPRGPAVGFAGESATTATVSRLCLTVSDG